MDESGKWQERWRQPLFPELDLDPHRTALIIIDMQYSFAHRKYGIGKALSALDPEGYERYFGRLEDVVVPNQVRLLDFFRRSGGKVIFVTLGSDSPDCSDLVPFRRKKQMKAKEHGTKFYFARDEFEYGILPELNPQPNEQVLHKTTSSAFNSTGIDAALRASNIDGLVLAGVATNGCVEGTARDAGDKGYNCAIVEDACAAVESALHEATLRTFSWVHGHVVDSDAIIGYLRHQRAPATKESANTSLA